MSQQALSFPFDSSKYAVRGSNDTVFDLSNSADLSIRFRFKFGAGASLGANYYDVLAKFDGGSLDGWIFIWDHPASDLAFYFNGSARHLGLGVPTLGVEHEIVITAHGTGASVTVLFYVDGVNTAGATSAAGTASTNPLIVGRRNVGAPSQVPMDGQVGEIAIWNRVLTATEVAQLYNQGLPDSSYKFTSGLIGYWPCNQDVLDWSDGLGTGSRPLTANGGIGYGACTAVFGLPVVSGTTPGVPTVSATPSSGSTIDGAQALQFDLTDSVGLSYQTIFARFPYEPTRPCEVIYSEGLGFCSPYSDLSSRSSISGGYRFTVRRMGGWPSDPTIYVDGANSTGVSF